MLFYQEGVLSFLDNLLYIKILIIMSKLRVELNNFDPNNYIDEKTNKIKTFIQTHSFNGVILGLHSLSHCSLTALLCSRAIGGSNVYVLNILASSTRYQSKIHNITIQ